MVNGWFASDGFTLSEAVTMFLDMSSQYSVLE